MRILVVEDERKVAGFIRQGLAEEGYAVEVACDGATALDLLVDGPPPDLVVLDLMLPRLDGFSLLKAARSRAVPTPVLVVTARDGVADKVRGLDLGADDYLTKPFPFDEFLARVRALLRRSAERRAPASIHTRLTLWYTSVLLITLLVTSGFSYWLLTLALAQDVDRALLGLAEVIREAVAADRAPETAEAIADSEFRDQFVQVVDAGGAPAYLSRGRKGQTLPLSAAAREGARRGRPTLET